MSSNQENQGRGTQGEISGGEVLAGLFGAVALVAIVVLFLWALWRAMEPVLMTWCSYAWVAP